MQNRRKVAQVKSTLRLKLFSKFTFLQNITLKTLFVRHFPTDFFPSTCIGNVESLHINVITKSDILLFCKCDLKTSAGTRFLINFEFFDIWLHNLIEDYSAIGFVFLSIVMNPQ